VPRDVILAVTQNRVLAGLGRRYGMKLGAGRFVGGETLEECLAVLHDLNGRGLRTYTILLGESVEDADEVARVVRTYCDVLGRLGGETLDNTMSMKLTHLGLMLDEDLAFDGIRTILRRAAEVSTFVRIDMEESRHVDATLRIYRRLRDEGINNTGVALQAYLYRTEEDLRSLLDLAPNVRIVKGAYLEGPTVAYPHKADVDRNYVRLVDLALSGGGFTAIATHDDAMIDAATATLRASAAISGGRYEFQLLYGVRPQLVHRLAEGGHPVRVCVPYGTDWFVYFGRRLAERPANIGFVVRSLFRG
jgi:proline dehydrogenase